MPARLGHGRGPRRPSRFFLTHNAPPQALDRSADDSLPTLTEAVARGVQALQRTAADSIATLTETTTRSVGTARTTGETLAGSAGGGFPLLLGSSGGAAGITESVSRAPQNLVRTAADSVSSITESVVRVSAKTRTTADTVGAISEAVVGVKTGGSQNYTATVSDSLAGAGGFPLLLGSGSGTGITESPTRLVGAGRSAVDTLGAISETVAEDAVDARTVQDVVTPISEAVSRQATLARTTADTVGAISEAVVGVVTPSGPVNYTRTVADSIAAISETATWPALSQGVEPAGQILPRYLLPDLPPQHFIRAIRDQVEFIDERIDDDLTESDEWLVLDMPELVLT